MSKQLERGLGCFADDLDKVFKSLLMHLPANVGKEAVRGAMHRDKFDEVLESLEGLLGILEESKVQAKSTIGSDVLVFCACRTVQIVNKDDRVETDVLRGALEDFDRLLPTQDVERIFGVVSVEEGKLRVHHARDWRIPAGIDKNGEGAGVIP